MTLKIPKPLYPFSPPLKQTARKKNPSKLIKHIVHSRQDIAVDILKGYSPEWLLRAGDAVPLE